MSTKLIVGCISGAGALGGVATGSYYLLNKETEKTQQVTNTNSQQKQPITKKSLKDELAGTDFEALSTTEGEDKDTWKKLLGKYNEDGVTGKIVVDETITKVLGDDDANIKKLQAACSKLLAKTDAISENDKTVGKNWCNKKSTLIPKG